MLANELQRKRDKMKITSLDVECYELSDFRFNILEGGDYVVFDLEATGPTAEADRITQVGAVRLGGRDRAETSFESLVRPGKPIPPPIEALTGITNARVAAAPDVFAMLKRFKAFCGDAVLVTQCGYEFDFPLLDQESGRGGLDRMANMRLDTKALFALLHPKRTETFSTNFLSDYYGINRAEFKRHDALGDARLITRIFQAELEEAKGAGIDALATDGLKIKRFVPPPL